MVAEGPRRLFRVLRATRRALGLTQRQLGESSGVSTRTVIRWESGQARPAPFQLRALADLLRADEPDLANELLSAAGVPAEPEPSPEPAPPQPEPQARAPGARHLVDAVVYAAADAMDASPRAVRPGIRAAFLRARELGLSVEAIVDAIEERKA